jgi:hypothetical protein
VTGARLLFFGAFLMIAGQLPVAAHSWYPIECCSAYDCMPADEIVTGSDGGRMVRVRDQRIPIPVGLAPRASPDSRIHICFKSTAGDLDGAPSFLPLCLFLPAQS